MTTSKILPLALHRIKFQGQKELSRISARRQNEAVYDAIAQELNDAQSSGPKYNSPSLTADQRQQKNALLTTVASMIGFDAALILNDLLSRKAFSELETKNNRVAAETLVHAIFEEDNQLFVSALLTLFNLSLKSDRDISRDTNKVIGLSNFKEDESYLSLVVKSKWPAGIFLAVIFANLDPQLIIKNKNLNPSEAQKLLNIANTAISVAQIFEKMGLNIAIKTKKSK
jgi:hypothetical protein